jgi:hypothetical protein
VQESLSLLGTTKAATCGIVPMSTSYNHQPSSKSVALITLEDQAKHPEGMFGWQFRNCVSHPHLPFFNKVMYVSLIANGAGHYRSRAAY